MFEFQLDNTYIYSILWSLLILILFSFILSWIRPSPNSLVYSPQSIPYYLQQLLIQQGKFKLLSRHIFLHSVYQVDLTDLESNSEFSTVIRIKKPRRESPPFLLHSMLHSSPHSQNYHFLFKSKQIPYQSVLKNASIGFNEYSQNLSNASKIISATLFLRCLSFLIQHKVNLDSIDWNHSELISSLIELGKLLPWQLYIIYFTLPLYHESEITVSVSVRGILKTVGQSTRHSQHVKQVKQVKESQESVKSLKMKKSDSWISHWLDLDSSGEEEMEPISSPHSRIKEQIIVLMMDLLKSLHFQSVQESLSHPLVQIANNLRKRLKWKRGSHLLFDEFLMTITACKLALPHRILYLHSDFYEFARKNALHRYLLVFNHVLKWDQEDILVLYKGKYEKWDDISCKIPRSKTDFYEMKGHYSQYGIIDRGLYEWTTLEPFIRASPMNEHLEKENTKSNSFKFIHDWGNRYILEVCSWIVSQPRLGGDHTWFRLKTPSGDMYSIGQYRPKKMGFHEQFIFPMKIKVSEFSSPDICEFWKGPYTTMSIEITENQFYAMKSRIEQDQNAKEHVYQLFEDNCVKVNLLFYFRWSFISIVYHVYC